MIKNSKTFLENPIYYSPWVMPIYRYSSSKNDVTPYYWTLILAGIIIGLAFAWTLAVTLMIEP